MVNNKLRTQAKDDASVIDPGLDPDFEDIEKRYASMKPTQVPGRDFLMAIAYNYPSQPTPEEMAVQRTFLHDLADAYPFAKLQKTFASYLEEQEPTLANQKAYTKWMYEGMKRLSKSIDVPIRSYKGYMSHLAYYKSGCSRKTYKGKTCRRLTGGGYTKDRNHTKTRRITHSALLA